MEYRIKNRRLCEIIWNSDSTSKRSKVDLILEELPMTSSFDKSQLLVIRKKLVDIFLPVYHKKWHSVSRMKQTFINKHANFLETDFIVHLNDQPAQSRNATNDKRKGRPRLLYRDGSDKTKRRRIKELTEAYSRKELLEALKMIGDESDSEPEVNLFNEHDENISHKTLAMFLDLGLSKRKYEKLRKYDYEINNHNSYPPYSELVQLRNACYPQDGEHIQTSQLGASVHFISLLGHTTERILLQMKNDDLAKLVNKKLVLFGKWGMDGASTNQMTRQKWSLNTNDPTKEDYDDTINICDDDDNVTDKDVFLICFVPLQLRADGIIVWTNETPSSIYYCRTIKFIFKKETASLVMKEYNRHLKLLKKVHTYSIYVNEMSFDVSFDLKCTMIDGKTCNVLTKQKSSSRCNICAVGPKFVNDLAYVVNLPCNEAYFQFGLSTLHAWIRVLEYLLHIAYNMDFKKFSARTKEEKQLKILRKKHIQTQLRLKLSLTVDVVKQGCGTTNTGNVARSFLKNAESVATITGLNREIIEKFHNILQVLTCGKRIDYVKLKTYCLETAQHCIDLYGWYKMPPSVHKLLIHGSDIAKSFELPIGWYSEEPQEGNNKIFRKARASNSRMCARDLTNIDTIHYLLLHSDPLISRNRITESRKTEPLSKIAEGMIDSIE